MVDTDPTHTRRISHGDDIGWLGDMVVGELADVNEALEAIRDASERVEWHEPRDHRLDVGADAEISSHTSPGIPRPAA